MPDSTRSSIIISASAHDIMAVIADVEAYPEWIPGLDSASAHGRDDQGRPTSATFQGSLGMIKDSYTVAYDWEESTVAWHLTKGEKLIELKGRYSCSPRKDGTTEVEYKLLVDLAIPVIGMLRRRGERVVVDSALRGLKRRVEG